VGAVAQTDAGWGGHVAWVESVNANGTVTIEEYNRDNAGHYSERRVAKGSFSYIHIKDIAKPKKKATPKPSPPRAPAGRGTSTGVYFPWDYSWHLSNALSPGASDYIFVRGKADVIPVVGDWDGDGKDSTGLYFPWDQSWHLRNELNPGPSEYIFQRGQPNAIPVVGDWNGDGKDSTGMYYPWDQSWHLRNELNPGPSQYAFQRGQPNSLPLVGNWDGL